MNFSTSTIYPRDRYHMSKVDDLLKQENIRRDDHLDHTIGIFDDDKLVATGSSYKNTLRCFAIDKEYQGYALMNTLVSELLILQNELGYDNSFVYTKKETGKFFEDLGFYPIASTDRLVFLENRKDRFTNYLQELELETRQQMSAMCPTSFVESKKNTDDPDHRDIRISSVVMNANPFTLGHLYLVEKTAAENDLLHLFMVSDDSSLIPFSIREKLIREGTNHLNNIIYHRTGSYMISQSIFPSYFIKEADDIILQQARLDIRIFSRIAKKLGITSRSIGSEPFSRVTALYNEVMQDLLPEEGIRVHIIPRKEQDEQAISASRVRELIQQDRIEDIRTLVPKTTYDFFRSEDARPIIERIQKEKDVIHY
ncbi:MAG: adenylyltransferase/cytidyltransferase family protein [Peptostreptococcaceae bacterium]|nr:adenylyltransferase/cytidyltransferase family protein [Peptostreptococcaceae bacterium]